MKLPKNSTGKFTQYKENFPVEFMEQSRFYLGKITAEGIKPAHKDYYNEKNQKKLSGFDAEDIVFFDIERHKFSRTQYLFLDFDHILNDGKFVNEKVALFVRNLLLTFPKIYIEYSVSYTGLHAFLKPDPDKFDSLTPAKFYFSDNTKKDAPQLEIFFKTNGRGCLLTGKKYGNSGGMIPANKINENDIYEPEVDNFLNNLLADIKSQQLKFQQENDSKTQNKKSANTQENPNNTKTATQKKFTSEHKDYNDPLEYKRDLILAAIKFIDFANEGDRQKDWLPVVSALKNEGFDREEIRNLCCSSSRYNEKKFDAEFNSLKNPNFKIYTIIGKASQKGFDFFNFKKNWYKDHPEFNNHSAYNDFDDWELKYWEEQLRESNKKIADFDAKKDSAIESLKNVEKFDKDIVFADDILTAAAFAYLHNKKVFSDFKAAIQNQIKLQKSEKFVVEWQGEVKSKAKEIQAEYSKLLAEKNAVQAKIQNFTFIADNQEIFPIPEGYSVSDANGIEKIVGEKIIPVCRCPVGIKNKLFNIENKTFKWILNFKSNGKWHDLPAQAASIIFNSRKLVDLVDYDLPVTSVNSFALVDYLDAFKNENQNKFPLVYVIPRCGWYEHNNKNFFIDPRRPNSFVTDEGKRIEIIPDSSNVFTKNLTPSGTVEEWTKAYNLAKTSPVARLFVAGSIAPTLLKVLGERNFVLYIHGKTTGGKTTALLLGASVVGSSKIIRTFEGSPIALKSAAVEVNHYPFFVDEKQHADTELKLNFAKFIYSMADTHGKTRADTLGKSVETKEFQNITLATGETVAINDNATGGAFTRLLQIQTPKILLDAKTCEDIRDIITDNYGVVFPKVIDKIFEIGFESLREMYSDFVKLFKAAYPDILPEHCRYVAILTVADTLLNVVLGSDIETAMLDAQTNANKIFPLIPTKSEIDDTEREKDFVSSFIAAKAAQFENSTTYRKNGERIIGDVLGKFDFDEKFVYLSTSALKQACKDSGFDEKKVVADLIDDKFFIAGKIQKGKKKADNSHAVNINGVKTRCYKIPLQSVQESDAD